MASIRSGLLVVIALAADVYGQYSTDYTWSVGTQGSTSICNETFADANATGIFSYDPGVPQLSGPFQYAKDIQIGATVTEVTNDAVEWSVWLNTNGANYSDDLALGYDMCLFTVQILTTNTYLRGQTDAGNCATTLDTDCNTALTDMASSYLLAKVQNGTPGPGSNLTAGSQVQVCYDVGNEMTDNFPQECNKFMNGTGQIVGAAITASPDGSASYGGCTLADTNSNGTFHHIITISGEASRFNYLVFNYFINPFILSWFPVANIDATNSISTANSVMSCPHVLNINPGSDSVPTAPSPTPIGSGGLSGGAIAGIVVGVVVGLALIAGAAFWFWRKSKKSKQTKADQGDVPPAYPADAKEKASPTPVVEAPADGVITELSPDNELRPELSGVGIKGEEKAVNEQRPAELLADVPQSHTGR